MPFLLFGWGFFWLFCLFLNVSLLFRTNSLYQWCFGNTDSLVIQTQLNMVSQSRGEAKALHSTQEACASFRCSASNPPLTCWNGMCLDWKWRGRETQLSCDMFTTAQLPTAFPSSLHVPCGVLTLSLPVTEAFGISLFITGLHNSKHLRDTH